MTEYGPTTIENKAMTSGDAIVTHDDLNRAFESFKETSDTRFEELKKRGAADVLNEEKLMRINRSIDAHQRILDELSLKAGRPQLSAGGRDTGAVREHKSAFDGFMRHGESAGLRSLEEKALSVGTDADGGYLVPDETETTVMRALNDISPIRAIAGQRTVSASVYKKPFALTGPASGWVAETAARTETASPTLAELSFPTMELYAMPAATQSLLDDAAVNIDEWLAEEVRIAFAEQEGTAFVSGNGINKPRGFLDYDKVAESAWAWGDIGYVATGVSGGFSATDPADDLIDLVYSLKSGYRQNAAFVMNRATQAAVRKIKDADGNYLWHPGERADASPTLMQHPIAESEDMPDIGANSFAIAFGDFRRGYLIVDRQGLRVLRDPYTSKPYVLFYTTKRVGGGVQDFDAIKLMKFGVS